MVVSAALANHSDLDDNGSGSSGNPAAAGQMEKTKDLRAALSAKSVDKAVKILTDNRFIGTSFISDGTKLVILEIYVNQDAYEREIKRITDEGKIDLEKMKIVDQVYKIMEGITDDDYDVASHETKKDSLAIRTNHGKLLPDAGYQEDDDDKSGWNSSRNRYSYAYKALDELGDDCHPFDVLTTLKNLNDVDKNPQHNPIRPKDGVTSEKPYYSSTILMLTPTGTMFAVPLDSIVDEKSKLTLKKDRKTHFILLPKNLPLFESTSEFIISMYEKEHKKLLFNEEVYKVNNMTLREKLIYESRK